MSLPTGEWPAGQPAALESIPHERGRPSPLARVGTLAVLVVVGAELAFCGAFLVPSVPHVLGIAVPLGPAVGLLGNLAAGLWVVRVTGSKLAVGAPALGWLLCVVPLGARRPEGDLVLTNGGNALAFLLLGALAWVVAAMAGRAASPGPPDGR